MEYFQHLGGGRVSPVHPGDTFLYYALDLLEHVGVFFIDPVSQVTTVIQDLMVSRVEEEEGRGNKTHLFNHRYDCIKVYFQLS